MDIIHAVASLSALAHDGRLGIFRLLVKAGPDGMAAGDIARKLGTQPNTMSAQLLLLSNAGLTRARRDRSHHWHGICRSSGRGEQLRF